MSELRFNHEFDAAYGEMVAVAPGIRRVVANNPGPFTGPGTGTYILGHDEVAVIDPGPMLPEHVNAIVNGLGDEKISHILITHTHHDHSPASRLLKQQTGAPIFGWEPGALREEATSAELEGDLDPDFVADFPVQDREVIAGSSWSVEAVFTPGHCAEHVCYSFLSDDGTPAALFCGDHLMAWSTTVILPPGGSISDYLSSLDRLSERAEPIYYPTHGAPITDPDAYIARIRAHRLQRIEQVEAALAAGCQSTAALRERIYPDLPAPLHGGAERSIQAALHYLNTR